MSSTLPRRTAAVTVLAVTAFSGVAIAGASVASATAKSHTSLSIRIQKTHIALGQNDLVSGQLRAHKGGNAAGQPVILAEHTAGSTGWTQEATQNTGNGGAVAFPVTPTVDTRYRLFFAGDAGDMATKSGVVAVHVNTKKSALTIAVGNSSINPGESDTVSGVLTDDGTPINNGTVYLLQRTHKHTFHVVQTASTLADGSVGFTVTPTVDTHYRLAFKKTASDPATHSTGVLVKVRKPSNLSIDARNAKKGTAESVTGDLRGGGKALRHRMVTLQDRASGTTAWTTVASKYTGKGGGVGFVVAAPTADEDYQLVFPGGPNFESSVSGIVTVDVPSVG